jgi:hypothetical protein
MGMEPMNNMEPMNDMGGDASFTGNDMEEPIDDENIEMGANAFGDESENEVTDDPEKKVESLIGKAASIIRKDLNSDGINKHEDKKKEVLGMLTSAIIDGLDDEERKGIIDYLSDKIQGDGESKGDVDGGSEDTSLDNETPDMGDGNENLDLSESIVKKFVKEFRNDFQRKNKNIASDIKNNKKGYRSSPFTL